MPGKNRATLRMALLTPILLVISIVLAGGGHGWMEPAIVLFPLGTLNLIWQDMLSVPLAFLGTVQYVVYGFLFDRARASGNSKSTLELIVTFHILLVSAILIFKN